MAVQFSVSVRNAMLDAIQTTAGTSAKVQLYTGAQPANCAAAATGTLLGTFSLASSWASAAASGSKSWSGTPVSTTAVAGGTIGYFRLMDSALANCHEQGSVTATGGGGDLTVDNPTVVNSQTINLTGWSWTAGNP